MAHAGVDDVRNVYDTSAERYLTAVGTNVGSTTETAFDQWLLRVFTNEVIARADRPRLADLGCGPGRAGAFVSDEAARRGREVEVVGLDLAAGLLVAGSGVHPSIAFAVAGLDRLPLASESLDGAVAWYSIIHTAPDDLSILAREAARVLCPGAPILMAFQAGSGEALHREDAYGSGRPLTSYRHDIDRTCATLVAAGLEPAARATRPAELPYESSPQAFLLATRTPR